MTEFIFLAAVLAAGGVAIMAIPLLKRDRTQLSPAPWAALLAAAVLTVGSTVLYLSLSNWSWRKEPAADSPQTMVARLARRLEREPNDLNGWLMLGQSYTVLQQYPLALRAFERADRLSGGKSVDALVGEAQALVLVDDAQLEGRGGRLIDQALALDPHSGKALFFGAMAASRRGQLPLARERFNELLALNPPASIRPLIERQIAAIDQRLAGSPEVTDAPGSSDAAEPAGNRTGAGGTDMALVSPGAKVRITVLLAPGLSAAGLNSSPLFVFVRDPQGAGPPLAVKRLQSHFPQTVELTASDSMMPGHALAEGQKVQVIARIARSGNPVGASGDPFGQIAYQVGHDGLLEVVIDRITP